MKYYICLSLLIFGGLICLGNFYLSYIRYGIFLLRGGEKDKYNYASGIPLLGSLLAVAALIGLHDVIFYYIVAFLLLIDTGGVFWLLGTTIYHRFIK